MKAKTVKIGIVGYGTVGTGVAKILFENAHDITGRTGLKFELARVVDTDTTSPRQFELPEGILTDELDVLLEDKSIDIALELVGGTTFAKDLQLKLLRSGKHVVTANKALLAEHGPELFREAMDAGEMECAGKCSTCSDELNGCNIDCISCEISSFIVSAEPIRVSISSFV